MSWFKRTKEKISDKQQISRLKVQLDEAKSNIRGLLKSNIHERGEQISDYESQLELEIKKIKKEYKIKLENKQTRIDTLVDMLSKNDERLKEGMELIGEQKVKILNLLLKIKNHTELIKNYKAEEINNSGAIIKEIENFLYFNNKFKKNMNDLIEE